LNIKLTKVIPTQNGIHSLVDDHQHHHPPPAKAKGVGMNGHARVEPEEASPLKDTEQLGDFGWGPWTVEGTVILIEYCNLYHDEQS
jgi:hypothetical protein